MNFFEHQQRARRRTWLLTSLFAAATGVILVITNAVALVVVALMSEEFYQHAGSFTVWMAARPDIVVWTSLGTLGVIAAASMYRMASIARGGGAVARALGGVYVGSDSDDPRKRQLRNVVEEMAIAAGVPVPELYVLEHEPGINAFAAGFTTSDAAIAVTRGALDLLTRDELQGVIAHEFSHVLNGDMRLNTRLLGVVFGLLFIGLTGRVILRGLTHVRSPRRGGGAAILALFLGSLALIVVGYVGTFFGAMIRAAVSRQREYLADASAVQFTRNPHGIAGALKKIAVSPLRAVLQAPEAEEIGHMLIADGRKMFASLFATHPPILARIKAIDRRFDPGELQHIKLVPIAPEPAPAAPKKPPTVSAALSPALLVAGVGVLSEAGVETAARLQAEIPESLQRAARSATLAPALVIALALNRDPAERARQTARLRERVPESLIPHFDAVLTMSAPLPSEHRLPLIELAFPALRQRSPQELRQLVAVVEELGRMDGRFDVLDYALTRMLRVQLTEAAAPQTASLAPAAKLRTMRGEAATLFAVMALAGARDRQSARHAYEQGMRRLFGAEAPSFAAPEPWIAPLDRALTRLDALAPLAKQSLLEALIGTVLYDRKVRIAEGELLRAVCASLHCPVPPLPAIADAAEAAGASNAAA